MRRLITALIAQVGTAVGCLVALSAWNASLTLRWTLAALVGTATLIAVVIEILGFRSGRATRFKTPARINRFMFDWISKPGQVVIFSNDMSWVDADVYTNLLERLQHLDRRREERSIRSLLIEKAQRDELTLCLPKIIPLSDQLARMGARVATYGELGMVPRTRFTIVRHGRLDAEVAIGRTVDGIHQIETFANGPHPALSLAEDLVQVIMQYAVSNE
jgi:hypothetical protein